MRPIVRRRPDGVIQIVPRQRFAAEAGVMLGLLGACGGLLAMLVTVLVRHPISLALLGSCLVFGLTTARWVSTGQVLPAGTAPPGVEASASPGSPPTPPTPPRGAA
jgi:hypothetical protein